MKPSSSPARRLLPESDGVFRTHLSVLAGGCGLLLASLFLGPAPGMAAPFAFLTLSDSNVVSKLDLATNLALNIPVGARPVGLAISPDGTRAYVANYVDSTI